MTCYEHLRKLKDQDKKETFKRLQSYFNAVDQNNVEEYHKKHGRDKTLWQDKD